MCYCVMKKGLGAGDVKLLAVLGAYLGWENTLKAAFVAVCSAMFYFLGNRCIHHEKADSEIPFAPFLLWGTVAVSFFAQLS